MDLNLELLSIQNPWWRGENLKFDPVVELYNRQALKWRPAALGRINLLQDRMRWLQKSVLSFNVS